MKSRTTSRDLVVAHRAAADRERTAWEYLQHMQVAGSPAQREEYMREWVKSSNEKRRAQEQLTRQTSQEVRSNLAAWLDDGTRPEGAPMENGSAPLRAGFVPTRGQKLRARDGGTWLVENLALDELEPGHFLAQITRYGPNGESEETMEVYGDDWPLVCLAYGLQPVD